MPDKIKIELGKVQETLLLPLWGRATETQKEHPKIIDKKAAEIIEKIDYDFTTISRNINWISQLAWVARSKHIDAMISRFGETHPEGTVINIGCGLDTTYERMGDNKLKFIDLDLPDVVELRKHFFKDDERRKTIACSFLDFNWIKEVDVRGNVLFIAAGVLYYFDENQVKAFFTFLADNFKNCYLFFDSASPLGVKVANKKVIEGGGMDKAAILKWGVKKAKQIETWDKRIKVVSEFPMFHGFKNGYPFKVKYGLWMSDFLKIMSMAHLRIEG